MSSTPEALDSPLLLDGATPDTDPLSDTVLGLHHLAADERAPLEERLEAFEDVVDSEVGDTSFHRGRNVEREVGFRQLYLKFEGGNPSGTQKDRVAFAQVMDAMRRRFEAITVATCGNYGAALSTAAAIAGMRCVIYIPESYQTRRLDEMKRPGVEIVRVPGDYERTVEASRRRAERDEIYDANPGGANTLIQLRAYGEIAFEIYDELRDAPAVVAVPVSNGTTLAGIYKGFLSLYRRGKTSRIPRLVAGSTFNKNPIIRAFLKNSPTCDNLEPERIRESKINEPLINWHSIDGDLALHAIRQSQGFGAYATDKAMLAYARMLREKEGLSVLPASTAGLIALLDLHQKQPLPGDRYVAVLTGKRT
ncbi:MAG: pyridoxal-phosphate dependent enzyme [Phycisphaerales bacterium]|nr:MAG: pyridoxal-phosphate dependent enzyme [Phycisphaerales bacterium]